MKKITTIIFTIVLLANFGSLANTINANPTNSLIITEVASYEPSNLEWLEIYNPGDYEIDLSSLVFFENNTRHGTQIMQGSNLIQPNTYAVIVNNYNDFKNKHFYISASDIVIDSSWSSLSENGEELKLELNGQFIENITYPANTAKKSQERILHLDEYTESWAHSLSEHSLLTTNTATLDINVNEEENEEAEETENPTEDDEQLEEPEIEAITEEQIPMAFLSEVSFKDSARDWIEILVPNPPEFEHLKGKLEIKIDQKYYPVNIDTSVESPTLIVVSTDLVGTTEQVLLTYDSKIIDGTCWQNATPATSELTELAQIQQVYPHMNECINSDEVKNNSSIGKTIFVPNSDTIFWQQFIHPTKNEMNYTKNSPPQAIITVQSGKTIATKETNLNLDGSLSIDPDNDILTYSWDFGNGIKSDKANPDTIPYKSIGEYTVTLTVTDPIGASGTYSLKILVNEAPTTSNSSNNSTKTTNTTAKTDTLASNIKFNQDLKPSLISFIPNPIGIDTNNEIITIQNQNPTNINLLGWQIDDGDGGSKPYKLPDKILKPDETLEIYNSESKISLNNDTDLVRILTLNGEVTEQAEYTEVKEGDIFVKVNNQWEKQTQEEPEEAEINTDTSSLLSAKVAGSKETSTNSKDSKSGTKNPNIRITEVMPNPEGTDSGNEWIELYNPTDQSTPLENWSLKINSKTFKFTSEVAPAKGYVKIVITKVSLPNEAAELFLLDHQENLIDHVKYDKSKEAKSFSLINGEFTWTDKSTPGAPNPKITTISGKLKQLKAEEQVIELIDESNKLQTIFYNENISIVPNSFIELEVMEENGKYYLVKITSMRLVDDKKEEKDTPYVPIALSTASLGTGLAFRRQLIDLIKKF